MFASQNLENFTNHFTINKTKLRNLQNAKPEIVPCTVSRMEAPYFLVRAPETLILTFKALTAQNVQTNSNNSSAACGVSA